MATLGCPDGDNAARSLKRPSRLAAAALLILLAGNLPACRSGPRLVDCEDVPDHLTAVRVSGTLGHLGPSCGLDPERFALALRLEVPAGTELALGNQPWTPDAQGIHWLDLRDWLLDLPPRAASRWSDRVDGPIALPLFITADGNTRAGELRLEVGSVHWSALLASVADGYAFPAARSRADPSTLVFVPSEIDDPIFLGRVDHLRDLGLVAVGHPGGEEQPTACAPEEATPQGTAPPPEGHTRAPAADPPAGWRVIVYDAHTARRVAERVFPLSAPCPGDARDDAGETGDARVPDAILDWLEELRSDRRS